MSVADASAGPDTSTRAGHRRDRRKRKRGNELAARRAHNGDYVTWTHVATP